MLLIRPVRGSEIPAVRTLIREYITGLPFVLDFQDYERELGSLPGEYAPPDGALFVALNDDTLAGCVALRRLDDDRCEMKRLFVTGHARGTGLGRRLAQAIIGEARRIGYRSMVLDTTPSMSSAIALYRDLGFREIAPYRFNPVEGALFFELAL